MSPLDSVTVALVVVAVFVWDGWRRYLAEEREDRAFKRAEAEKSRVQAAELQVVHHQLDDLHARLKEHEQRLTEHASAIRNGRLASLK